MIPLKTQATLVRLSRSSINIAKRTSREPPPRTVISVFCQKRTFISIVNPDAPRIVKIRKSASTKSDTGVESEKVLSLRQFLSVPKPITEKIDTTNISSDVVDTDTVVKTFDEAIQLTIEQRTDHENPENTEHKHDVTENNNRKEEVLNGNVLKDDINNDTLHHKEETNSSLGVRKQEEVEEKENKVVEEINEEEDTAETLHQNEAHVEETRSSIVAAEEEGEAKETKVTEAEETDQETLKEEQSLSVSQEENVTQSEEDVESGDESDSSSDSESSSSSSSSSSDSESDDRDNVGRKRLDQVKQTQLFSKTVAHSKMF